MSVKLLDDISAFLGRFIAYPSEQARTAHTLWIAHTHLMGEWDNTPRLAFLSPEPGSGKSRALEITELLVPRALLSMNATPAYIFRKVGAKEGLPTLLLDEIDTVFGERSKRDGEELRGLINAGHRRGATAGKCVTKGTVIETQDFPAYCAVAMAGLGSLPDSILTRSIVIRMRKRKKEEAVESFRRRQHEEEAHALRDRLQLWAASLKGKLVSIVPAMPEGVTDRDADVWEPLLSIADHVGGTWPERSRVTAVTFVTYNQRDEGGSLGLRLLSDIRIVMGDEEKISTYMLLSKLLALANAPWGSIKGGAISDRNLSNMLKEYDITSKSIRIKEKVLKGYDKRDFVDAWERYLPSSPQEELHALHGLQPAQSVQEVLTFEEWSASPANENRERYDPTKEYALEDTTILWRGRRS